MCKLRPDFHPRNSLQTENSFRLVYIAARALSGNAVKFKFECKKIYLFQFLNEKNYKYVADLNFQIFPDTVLLFELRMRHPALRVIENTKNN